jgi:hypothetical protein
MSRLTSPAAIVTRLCANAAVLGMATYFATGAAVSHAELSDSKIFPPRMIQPEAGYTGCRQDEGLGGASISEVAITLVITKKGKADRVSLPDGSPGWMGRIAECVIDVWST